MLHGVFYYPGGVLVKLSHAAVAIIGTYLAIGAYVAWRTRRQETEPTHHIDAYLLELEAQWDAVEKALEL